MAGGAPASCIAKWDGSNWSALGSGLNYPPTAFAPDGAGRLYVAGAFTIAGTNASAYVAQANILNLISKTHRNTDGSVTFDLLTTPNSSSRVMAATNLSPLTIWQPIYTNVVPANGAWQFTDTNASSFRQRFYRASMP